MSLLKLLIQCKKNNVLAQRNLYDQFVVHMFLVCRRYVKNDSIAEECMLNGFLKFFQSLHSFQYKDHASTIAYLKKIMVNECLQQLRTKSPVLLVAETEALDVSVDTDILSSMSADEIYNIILLIPEGYRTVFNLSVMEGLSHKEIAALLGIKEGTSKSQLSKAKQMLQHLLINNNSEYAARRAK